MSSEVAIRCANLSKQYRIGEQGRYGSLRESMMRAAQRSVGRAKSLIRRDGRRSQAPRSIWALQDVDFDVATGEVFGLIGRNGAGKSTLLKILSRITRPTFGYAELAGRVGPLLEVGTGFHPELTGRENIYLNGAVLGMKRHEINRKFDEMVAFADIGSFLDTPIKRYSSGMYMRLAFAVAAHLEPEILLVDEVLAVGDAAFQKKSLGKMTDVARAGHTIMFVSHNMEAVQRLCDRVAWIDEGKIRFIGRAQDAVSAYLLSGVTSNGQMDFDPPLHFPGGIPIGILGLRVYDGSGKSGARFPTTASLTVQIEWRAAEPLFKPRIGFVLRTASGVDVLTTVDATQWHNAQVEPGTYISSCTIPGGLLNEGEYVVALGADSPNRFYWEYNTSGPLLRFELVDEGAISSKYYGQEAAWDGRWAGTLLLDLPWSSHKLERRSI